MNTCTFMGRFGADPELKTTQNGVSVCSFLLAVDRTFTTHDGDKGKETTWLRMEVWAEAAQMICKHFKKGNRILVEASAKNNNWENAQGEKRHEIVFRVNKFYFCDSKRNEEEVE